jgi:oxygen-independent coproporphyrinogen-3 oxidase
MFTHARRYTIQNVNLQSLAGIYIHIPFCRQACTYCNFHFSTSLKLKDEFLSALHTEISFPNDFIDAAEKIETIYFGGGTPSLLLMEELERYTSTIRKKFNVVPDAEITLEANPDDISTFKSAAMDGTGHQPFELRHSIIR